MDKTIITVETLVNVPTQKAWTIWTTPEHIMQWNKASEDWHTTKAENDVRVGGKFMSRMEAKDGNFGFDFSGVYDDVKQHEKIAYTLGDGRKVEMTFEAVDGATKIIQRFEAEGTNSIEMQKTGWQAIMDNYKQYTEAL